MVVHLRKQINRGKMVITFFAKFGFNVLSIVSVRQISTQSGISYVFKYVTHIGSDLENTSQSNSSLKKQIHVSKNNLF